jgi:hypothetical protein
VIAPAADFDNLFKMQMAMKAMAETTRSQQKATEMLNRVMAETYAMATEFGPLSATYNDELYRAYKLVVYTAGRLAPYQDPQLATVKVGGMTTAQRRSATWPAPASPKSVT